MKIEIIKNKNISLEKLKEIILLKQEYWNYCYEDQVKWIKENLQDNDLHFLLYTEEELTAYLNIVEIKISSELKQEKFLGIGNVCVSIKKRKKGFGKIIIKEVNKFINKSNIGALLLCKNSLIPFYSKCNWIKIPVKEKNIFINKQRYLNIIMGIHFEDSEVLNNFYNLYIDKNF